MTEHTIVVLGPLPAHGSDLLSAHGPAGRSVNEIARLLAAECLKEQQHS